MLSLKTLAMQLAATTACALLLITAAFARADERTPRAFDIGPQSLATALSEYARQSQQEILFAPAIVADKTTEGLHGVYPPLDALKQILGDTGLTFSTTPSGAILVQPSAPGTYSFRTRSAPQTSNSPETPDTGTTAKPGFWSRFRLAQNDQSSSSKRSDSENQDLPSPQATGMAIPEVIVTAQKRTERLLDVPVSIAVIGNQEIERRGLIGMEDYLRSIPSVNQIDTGPSSNAIVIRGIATSPQAENSAAGTTVASYFDETPITAAAGYGAGGIDVRPADIERIEILRGPQGTAFGDASLGGTLRLIPAKPVLDRFSARIAADYSGTSNRGGDNSMIQGVLNIPLVADRFALRAVGYRYDESGFYGNIAGIDPATIARAESQGLGDFVRGFVQDDVGQTVSTGGRLAALWEPTDRLSLSLSYLTQKIEQDGEPIATLGWYEQARMPIAPQGRVRGEAGSVADTDIDLTSLVLNYDLGWSALTSVASWIDSGSVFARDVSAVFGFPISTTAWSDFKSFTAETRLASKLDGSFQFLGGVFYEDIDEDYFQPFDWAGAPAPTPIFVSNPAGLTDRTRNIDQRAVFGEISYALAHNLTATVGGRFFDYEKNESVLREGGLFGLSGGAPITPIGAGTPVFLESSESDSNLKANLTYKPTQDSLLYASWAQGFRLGRPDVGAIPALCDTNNDGLIDGSGVSIESTRTIESDSLDNYEIGTKLTLLGHRLAVDAAVFRINWDELPVRATGPTATCGYVANAGAAVSEGVEFQASLFAMQGLRVDFGAGYTRAKLTKDAIAPGQDWRKGDRLPGAPKVSANLAAQYDFDVAGYSAFVRADSLYTGEFFGDFRQSPNLRAGDYVKIDARAGVSIKKLSVELFVRNLTNEDAFTWRSTSPVVVTTPFFGFQLRPRTVGIQLGYRFE